MNETPPELAGISPARSRTSDFKLSKRPIDVFNGFTSRLGFAGIV
jgi:hypothetical protein